MPYIVSWVSQEVVLPPSLTPLYVLVYVGYDTVREIFLGKMAKIKEVLFLNSISYILTLKKYRLTFQKFFPGIF